MKDRINALNCVDWLALAVGEDDDLEKFVCPSKFVDGDDFISPEYLNGSDYSGSTVTKVNYRVFEAEFKDVEGVHLLTGAFGNYGVIISVNALLDNEEILEVLEGLEDYPCIDDEALCELEMELIEDAWEGCIRDEYCELLEIEINDSDIKLRELFSAVVGRVGDFWEADGNAMTIDVIRIAEATTYEDMKIWL